MAAGLASLLESVCGCQGEKNWGMLQSVGLNAGTRSREGRVDGQESARASICAGEVEVVTNDGRVFVGRLRGMDQTMNMILSDAVERIFHPGSPVELVALGAYLVRGDNVAIVAELDMDKEAAQDLSAIRAEPLKAVVH
jgi:U6 snRNA-associated Sm-like protein LSm8